MSITTVPPAGSPAWREIFPVPPQLRMQIGPWCSLDDSRLQVNAKGWDCPRCLAAWDFHGEISWWLPLPAPVVLPVAPPAPRRRLSLPVLAGGLAGCFAAAAGIAVPLARLDEHVVLGAAGVPAAAAVGIVAAALTGRARDWVRFRHNTSRRLDDAADVLVGEVSDDA